MCRCAFLQQERVHLNEEEMRAVQERYGLHWSLVSSRNRHKLQNFGNQIIGRNSISSGFIAQYETVAEHCMCNSLHILGKHKAPACTKGRNSGTFEQCNSCTGRGTKG